MPELTPEQLAAKAAAQAELRKDQANSNTYRVLRPLLHDTTEFTAGDKVIMTPRQAQHLVATKAIALDVAAASSIEPADLTVKGNAAQVAFDAFMMETSGGHHASAEDWTTVGMDKTGFPVPKGSVNDVSAADLRFQKVPYRQNS